jgi:hypothetical protein
MMMQMKKEEQMKRRNKKWKNFYSMKLINKFYNALRNKLAKYLILSTM